MWFVFACVGLFVSGPLLRALLGIDCRHHISTARRQCAFNNNTLLELSFVAFGCGFVCTKTSPFNRQIPPLAQVDPFSFVAEFGGDAGPVGKQVCRNAGKQDSYHPANQSQGLVVGSLKSRGKSESNNIQFPTSALQGRRWVVFSENNRTSQSNSSCSSGHHQTVLEDRRQGCHVSLLVKDPKLIAAYRVD